MKQDFEKRLQIEESLIESEKKYRNLSEEIADGVAVSIDGKIKWVNKAFPDIFGFESELSIGHKTPPLYQSLSLQY